MATEEIESKLNFTFEGQDSPKLAGTLNVSGDAAQLLRKAAEVPARVALQRSTPEPTESQALWTAIRNRTDAIGFNPYTAFIERVLCTGEDKGPPVFSPSKAGDKVAADVGSPPLRQRIQDLIQRPTIYGTDAYQVLKMATNAFLLWEGGVAIQPPRDVASGIPAAADPDLEAEQAVLTDYLSTRIGPVGGIALPYLKQIVAALPANARAEGSPFCDGLLRHRFSAPVLMEYIWCYWIEESGLMQAINAVSLRFQNRRRGAHDQLATLTLDPLRPLSNLFWGWVQDGAQRLTVPRRAAEYRSQYGLDLCGSAVAELETVESRSKFLVAFHTVLYRALEFYARDADTTIESDGFPLLQALKQLHLELAYGAVNQFDEITRIARGEMLMAQWLFARPEMREFMGGRPMVPYRESWMRQAEAMNQLQGWNDVSVTHFRDLAVFGEQLLLSARYHAWTEDDDQDSARNWARAWKNEVQSYVHAYHAVTGVDLSAEVTAAQALESRYAQPSSLLRNHSRSSGRTLSASTRRPT